MLSVSEEIYDEALTFLSVNTKVAPSSPECNCPEVHFDDNGDVAALKVTVVDKDAPSLIRVRYWVAMRVLKAMPNIELALKN